MNLQFFKVELSYMTWWKLYNHTSFLMLQEMVDESYLLGKWLGSWATSAMASGFDLATVQMSSLV